MGPFPEEKVIEMLVQEVRDFKKENSNRQRTIEAKVDAVLEKASANTRDLASVRMKLNITVGIAGFLAGGALYLLKDLLLK